MARATQLFATRSDWLACLAPIQEDHPLAFTLSGMFDSPTASTFVGCASSPDFGTAAEGSTVLAPCYLMHSPDSTIEPRSVPQRRGGILYSIDNRLNRFTVGLTPGGLHSSGVIIAGQLGPPNDDAASRHLHALVLQRVTSFFTSVKSYFVGPDALQLLDCGSRLTVSADADSAYDLIR